MKEGQLLLVVVAAVLSILLLSSPGQAGAASVASNSDPQAAAYPSASWALGVVVPEGSALHGGGQLRWETASNITASVTLPMISRPDRPIYAVLSIMAGDGSVMQVAAGANANHSGWLAYSWFISDVHAPQISYDWILNASGPQMAPGDRVSLSIYWASSQWDLRVVDDASGASVGRAFPAGISSSLEVGDQEVFALESYTRTASTFSHMGNLTLEGAYVDGRKVTSGFYYYSDWDMIHNPVFVVGSSGTSAPTFISIQREADGSSLWSYSGTWRGSAGFSPLGWTEIVALLLVGSAIVIILVFAVSRMKHSGGAPHHLGA